MSNRPSAPLFATVNITGVCNLACQYCFYQPREQTHMSWPAFRRVIDELAERELFFVNLSGGEPFAHPEIDRFLRYAHERFVHVVVLTNGTLLRPRNYETIAAILREKRAFPVQVSLDAVSPEVNAATRSHSRRTLKNIRRLSEAGANIVIAMVVNQFNAGTLLASISHLSQYTRYFHLMRVQEVKALPRMDAVYGLSEAGYAALWKQVDALRKELGLHIDLPGDDAEESGCASGAPCMAAFSHLVIDPSLKVRPCDRLVDVFIGDLNVQSVREVWNGPGVRPILESPVPYCKRLV